MGQLIAGAVVFNLVVWVISRLPMLPHIWRRALEAILIFAGLVVVVFFIAIELAMTYRPGATASELLPMFIALALEFVLAAWLSLQIAMRMSVIMWAHLQRKREEEALHPKPTRYWPVQRGPNIWDDYHQG